MKYYLFAKFFQHLSIDELMAHCAEAGVDGPTAVIREGYWLEPESYAEALPGYVQAAEKAGLEVKFADTSFPMGELARDNTPLKVLADNGIEAVRLGYIAKNDAGHMRDLANLARYLAEGVAHAAEDAGIKAVIQLHGNCYPHNSTAAWPMVKGLDPKYIGIMIDPGNNLHQEGFERWDYQIQLLGEYIAAVGAKDAVRVRSGQPDSPTKGWVSEFVPAFEGQANWEQICAELHNIGFSGPMILMPFYDTDNFPLMYKKFKQEVEYLRNIEKAVGK
ncbi:MAG: sugar phosphate isomerase/epimerase [Armatimonadetes bacterium]|nr:sugar phosphate isomerase/epimerase [Armatimonadota bacterium]